MSRNSASSRCSFQVAAITLLILGIQYPVLSTTGYIALWMVVLFAILSAVDYFRTFWSKIDDRFKAQERRRRHSFEEEAGTACSNSVNPNDNCCWRSHAQQFALTWRKKSPPVRGIPDGTLGQSHGVFVSLHRGAELRGCIGRVQSDRPLYETTAECAVSAAVADPRFVPMEADELDHVSFRDLGADSVDNDRRHRPARSRAPWPAGRKRS